MCPEITPDEMNTAGHTKESPKTRNNNNKKKSSRNWFHRIHNTRDIRTRSTSVTLATRPFDFAHDIGHGHGCDPTDCSHRCCYFSHNFSVSAMYPCNCRRSIAMHEPAATDLRSPHSCHHRRPSFSRASVAVAPVAECQRIRAVAFGGVVRHDDGSESPMDHSSNEWSMSLGRRKYYSVFDRFRCASSAHC